MTAIVDTLYNVPGVRGPVIMCGRVSVTGDGDQRDLPSEDGQDGGGRGRPGNARPGVHHRGHRTRN